MFAGVFEMLARRVLHRWLVMAEQQQQAEEGETMKDGICRHCGEHKEYLTGDKVMCNGYEGRVECYYIHPDRESCGMVNVRLRSGSVCVPASELKAI